MILQTSKYKLIMCNALFTLCFVFKQDSTNIETCFLFMILINIHRYKVQDIILFSDYILWCFFFFCLL